MKIVDNSSKRGSTTLNEIPVGTIFRGDIIGPHSGYTFSGIYYKADGSFIDTAGCGHDVCVVRLDKPGREQRGIATYANAFLICAEVRNYEPLDVELVIKGKL